MPIPESVQSVTSPLNPIAHANLFAADFDGTAFNTFEQDTAVGIVGVDEAYRIAIERTFDFDKDALRRYEDIGGHNNRTPTEIVNDLAPHATNIGLQRLTETLVAQKLAVLFHQIGKPLSGGEMWPRPIPGFLECWQAISDARRAGRHINTAMLSAGHAPFIRRALDIYGAEQPDVLITDETIRGLNSNLDPKSYAKPTALPPILAKVQWFTMHGAWASADLNDPSLNARITMVGDSLEMDGGLAAAAGVEFFHVGPDSAAEAYRRLEQRLMVGAYALVGAGAHE